jgi:hypothetical protein
METENVINNAIPKTVPTVKSADERTMFMRRLGAFHVRDRARDTTPATRRRKSRTAQTTISFLETMVDVDPSQRDKTIKKNVGRERTFNVVRLR